MPNTLILNKSDPEIAAALADCEVGVPKEITLTVTPTVDDDAQFVATVDEVHYTEKESASEELVSPTVASPPTLASKVGMPKSSGY